MKTLLILCVLLGACRSESRPPASQVGAPSSLSASPSSAGPNNAKTDLQTAEAKPRVVDVTAEDYVMPRLPTAVVTLVGRANQPVTVEVEVAATRDARTRGLMWRYTLVEGMGMLFIFTRDQPLSFWMRNTLIPLDMLFIDSKGKVVSIVENAEPKTLSSRASTGPAMYVLEVPGGWCAKAGVKAGSHVSFQGVTNIVPEE